jgi:hypothetical protein
VRGSNRMSLSLNSLVILEIVWFEDVAYSPGALLYETCKGYLNQFHTLVSLVM